jgi:SAM-dependent methyltransferase
VPGPARPYNRAVDERIAAELDAYRGDDAAFVERAFRELLRRSPDPEAQERALRRLADGTLSRATLVHELTTSDEHRRVRQLDDAVALGVAARARGERLRWLAGPPGADERVIEVPWVLSRLAAGSVLEVGYAFAEPAYVAALVRAAPERLVGVDLATREVDAMETVVADVRSLPFSDGTFDQVLLVSTLEHVGADNEVYGLPSEPEADPGARLEALRELRRVLRRDGRLLVTVPLGEPGDHGWFRQDDVRGWTRLFARARLFVEEQEAYELSDDGWGARPDFRADGVRYGERGPAASAVLCTELSPSRARRLASPEGIARTARRRIAPAVHRSRRRGDASRMTA